MECPPTPLHRPAYLAGPDNMQSVYQPQPQVPSQPLAPPSNHHFCSGDGDIMMQNFPPPLPAARPSFDLGLSRPFGYNFHHHDQQHDIFRNTRPSQGNRQNNPYITEQMAHLAPVPAMYNYGDQSVGPPLSGPKPDLHHEHVKHYVPLHELPQRPPVEHSSLRSPPKDSSTVRGFLKEAPPPEEKPKTARRENRTVLRGREPGRARATASQGPGSYEILGPVKITDGVGWCSWIFLEEDMEGVCGCVMGIQLWGYVNLFAVHGTRRSYGLRSSPFGTAKTSAEKIDPDFRRFVALVRMTASHHP